MFYEAKMSTYTSLLKKSCVYAGFVKIPHTHVGMMNKSHVQFPCHVIQNTRGLSHGIEPNNVYLNPSKNTIDISVVLTCGIGQGLSYIRR